MNLNKLKIQHGISRETLACIQEHIGSSIKVTRVSGGLVHYIYKVTGQRGAGYLKIRGTHFSGVPEIETEPHLIGDEARALKLYNSYFPAIFPRILDFDEKAFCLVLSDVMPHQETFEDNLNNNVVRDKDIRFLGLTIGKIHSVTSYINRPIRIEGDDSFRERQLYYLLESAGHPRLTKIVKEYKKRQTNLILGDPSPKNIGIKNGQIGICDLENSRQCSYAFELGHIIAHLLIHNLGDQKKAERFTELFLSGYKTSKSDVNISDPLLTPTMLGILLYRLNNPVIPYNLNISKKERLSYEMKARYLLHDESLTMQKVIRL